MELPLGPFTKHPLNPVITSGHETSLFPFREGVAALVYKDGRGITWGLAHFINYNQDWDTFHSVLVRFDCDLSLDFDDPEMKQYLVNHAPDVYYTGRD